MILALTMLTLFTSTTIYLVAFAMAYKYIIAESFANWVQDVPSIDSAMEKDEEYRRLQYCAGTAALTINASLHVLSYLRFIHRVSHSRFTHTGHIGRHHCLLEGVCHLAKKPRGTSRLRCLLARDVWYAPSVIHHCTVYSWTSHVAWLFSNSPRSFGHH